MKNIFILCLVGCLAQIPIPNRADVDVKELRNRTVDLNQILKDLEKGKSLGQLLKDLEKEGKVVGTVNLKEGKLSLIHI